MKYSKLTFVATTFFLAGLFIGCNSGGNSGSEGDNTTDSVADQSSMGDPMTDMEPKTVYCLYNNNSVREEPHSQGKYMTALRLGETVTFLGEVAYDSAKDMREYIKIELSDGKQGWCTRNLMLMEGTLAVTLEEVSMFNRPDLLTKNDKTIPRMVIVGLYNPKDDWTEIKGIPPGETWYTSGWTKSPRVSTDEEDIAAAYMISQALSMDDDEKMKEALESALSTFSNSEFAVDASELLVEMAEAAEMELDEAIDGAIDEVMEEEGEM